MVRAIETEWSSAAPRVRSKFMDQPSNRIPGEFSRSGSARDKDFRDEDPLETREWIESVDSVIQHKGVRRGSALLREVFNHARSLGVRPLTVLNTSCRNTIGADEQPSYPGDLELEARITALVRWNALAMVVRANKDSTELGGHLASYASAADLFEVGFNHFFRGRTTTSGASDADLVFLQPHAGPGVYARAFLEGRLTEENLAHFRRETAGKGLSSYPHPWSLPEFWQFPTGSMGLGVITAVYQGRFMRYLEDRGLIRTTGRRVWGFYGDGEMDEPESTGALSLAAREGLDNLTFVINCNLQRLDGPVRGNGSIIRDLEATFSGAGWNVIKLMWGSEWDPLFKRDHDGLLRNRLDVLVDGELQRLGARDGKFNREYVFGQSAELAAMVAGMSDTELEALSRGGHDPVKIYAAFDAAVRHKGAPTVVLALTRKGFGLGRTADSRMGTHQQKKLEPEALLDFRDRFQLPLTYEQASRAEFLRPDVNSPEMRYLLHRRDMLGGFLPSRSAIGPALAAPTSRSFGAFSFRQEEREMSTTIAFVRMLQNLMKDRSLGARVVPIVADEARTFGMQSLFRQSGIYSHCGQLYEPEDSSDFLFYNESKTGQILQEGISEAGALSSWIAAGTSYSHHNFPTIPFYIFYSIFGFQRVGDLIWAAADSRARGFLVGGTAGRTSLSGEGLQHQDGSSHLAASAVPNCRAWDPCFAYELAVILEDGLKAMMERHEDVFYYITAMNENYVHPAMPADTREGILRGMYRIRSGCETRDHSVARVQLLGAGTILREALAAAELLEKDWDIVADVWSVTSFTELRRAGLETERWNRLHVAEPSRLSWVERCLMPTQGPVVAASDYVRAVPDLIRTWVPRRFVTLGTDGFGRSDRRAELRRFFEVDALAIAFAAVCVLVQEETLPHTVAMRFQEKYGYSLPALAPWEDRRTPVASARHEGIEEPEEIEQPTGDASGRVVHAAATTQMDKA